MSKKREDYLDQLWEVMLDAVNHGDVGSLREVVRICREHGEQIDRLIDQDAGREPHPRSAQ